MTRLVTPAPRRVPARRLAAAAALFVIAPIGAEYLVGYDTSTGHPVELLAGLLILAPLYGGAALVIREVAVRLGVGWPGIVCWATAFGLVQAGLVDQSLFNPSYRDISYWDHLVGQTWVPMLGLGLASLLTFVVGHVVWSICAPIILVSSLTPAVRDRAWLGKVGLGVVVLGYLAASALIVDETLATEDFAASPAQLVATGVVVVAMLALGCWLGRRPRPRLSGHAPRPWLVAPAAFVAAVAFGWDESWLGATVSVAVLVVVVVTVDRWSRRDGWSPRHLLMLAGGALLAHALIGFLVDPIGDGPQAAKYVHNALAVALIVGLVWAGWRRTGPAVPQTTRELVTRE